MNKKGMSHVEIILSFVIFITAVGFALYFFNPGDSDRLVESSLTYAFTEISENTSLEIKIFTVLIKHDNPINENSIAFNFSGIGEETRVETYEGVLLNS